MYYSKKERRGITVLIFVTIIITIFPAILSAFLPKEPVVDYSSKIDSLKAEATIVKKPNYNNYKSYNGEKEKSKVAKNSNRFENTKTQNKKTLKRPQQEKKPKQKSQPTNYNKQKENILKSERVVVAQQETLIRPNIEKVSETKFVQKKSNSIPKKKSTYQKFEKTIKDSNIQIDINTASAKDFTLLKGIGEKLSKRIITFRTALGGFTSVNQVGDTFGIEPEVFNEFKNQLKNTQKTVKQHNFNTETLEQLSAHPYISPKLAAQIINFREKVKPYQSYDDVEKLYYFKNQPELYKKLKPYISF